MDTDRSVNFGIIAFGSVFIVVGIIVMIAVASSPSADFEGPVIAMLLFAIGGFLVYKAIEDLNMKKEYEEQINLLKIKIDDQLNKISQEFPLDGSTKIAVKMLDKETRKSFNMLMNTHDDVLLMIPDKGNSVEAYREFGFENAELYVIPFSNIQYYLQDGESHAKVSGYGGHTSFSMVTGWHGKVNPVHISTQIVDKKHTRLYYNYNGEDKLLTFAYDDYHKFKKIIPNKDFNLIQREIENTVNTKVDDDPAATTKLVDNSSQLRSLKQLFDDGILTEAEYTSKKKEILERI